MEHVVRYASKETKVPIIVTENGIATEDDSRRVEYFQRALTGLKRAIDDGVDVRGYVAWSLMDNFEWMSGFTPKFGIVAVDLDTEADHQAQRCGVGEYRTHEFPIIWSSVFLAANDKFSDGSENVYMNRRYCLTLDLKNDPTLIAEYKSHHQNIWPEITKSMKDSGIEDMEIYLLGTRMFMIMEVNEHFSFATKAEADHQNPKVQEWENLMWKFQQALPDAKPGEKWLLMEKVFKLES